jgi:hypothetical protein
MDEATVREAFAHAGEGPEPPWQPDIDGIVAAGNAQRRQRRRARATFGGAAVGVSAAVGAFVIMPLWSTGPPAQGPRDQGRSVVTQGGRTPSPRPVDPAPAYARCASLVTTELAQRGESAPGRLRGRVAAITALATTVVVGDGKLTWTCNLKPDKAVSASRRVPNSTPRPDDFAVAENVTGGEPPVGNALPQPQQTPSVPATSATTGFTDRKPTGTPRSLQELVWGGGALPPGVTSVTYAFPDGHTEAALTRNGYWVMQYLTDSPFAKEGQPVDKISPIKVRLAGPAGSRMLALTWGTDTCIQISHGC